MPPPRAATRRSWSAGTRVVSFSGARVSKSPEAETYRVVPACQGAGGWVAGRGADVTRLAEAGESSWAGG
jgi:hypothetical protein